VSHAQNAYATYAPTRIPALTHSRALSSTLERRENNTKVGLCNAFCFVQDLFIFEKPKNIVTRRTEKKITLAFSLRSVSETVHRLCNDRVMPVFTPGSNTQRLTAAVVTERVVNFLLSLRKEESKSREVGGAGFGLGQRLAARTGNAPHRRRLLCRGRDVNAFRFAGVSWKVPRS
jgi:hypothetical protein